MGCHRYEDTQSGFIAHAQKSATVFFIVLAVWAMTGFGAFWPGWVLLFCGLTLGAHARRVYGGRDVEDDPAEEPVDEFV